MKTVMHITEVLSGGVLPVISGICNGLSDKYNFVVLYGVRFDTPENLDEIFDDRVKLIPLPSLKLRISLKDDLKAIHDIKRYVKTFNPDVVHIHSTKAGIDARIGLLWTKAKKYYTPHGFCFLRRDNNVFKSIILKTMEFSLAKFCDGIIACGEYEYKQANKLTKRTFLIENGIDTDYIDKIVNATIKEPHKYTVYTAGRIGPQKNPQMFNEIAAHLPEYKFVWIGDGEERYTLNSTNIEVTGVLPRDEVIKRAVNYDCYLSTSLWEGLPIALMEAMYMGKKCVVSAIEGNMELITAKKTGDVFENTFEACKKIVSDECYTAGAIKRICKSFSLKTMCDKYNSIYG